MDTIHDLKAERCRTFIVVDGAPNLAEKMASSYKARRPERSGSVTFAVGLGEELSKRFGSGVSKEGA
jgi:hypothetical protein